MVFQSSEFPFFSTMVEALQTPQHAVLGAQVPPYGFALTIALSMLSIACISVCLCKLSQVNFINRGILTNRRGI